MATVQKRGDVTIMLLGPGKNFLNYRRAVKGELQGKGYNVLIMEDERDDAMQIGLDAKFLDLVNREPNLHVAFFHTGARMDAVIFEIGCLVYHYGSISIGNKLRILYDKGYDWAEATAYINTLLERIPRVEIDETKPHRKASAIIHRAVLYLKNNR